MAVESLKGAPLDACLTTVGQHKNRCFGELTLLNPWVIGSFTPN